MQIFDSEAFRKRWGRAPSATEKGCMLSHLNMWRDFLASDADWALIAEDDAVISADADRVVQRIIERYPEVQLVNLSDGYSFHAGVMNPRMRYISFSSLSVGVRQSTVWGKCTALTVWSVLACTCCPVRVLSS